MFGDAVLNPKIDAQDIEESKTIVGLHLDSIAPELLVKEAIQEAAYPGQALGRPHFVTPETLPGLSAEGLKAFQTRHFTARSMVLAAAGVEHEAFVDLAKKHFGRLPAGEGAHKRARALYQGGEKRIEQPDSIDPFTRVAVGFEVAGWHDKDLVAMCVMQILLGGGDSFSAGGPGKGMYSRLYRELLNRYYWVEGAEAFVNLHNETGVLGIAGACEAARAGQLMHEFCAQICKLALTPVDPVELSRARNMLKCNVLTQLESRIILFEDIGRQMITYGHREAPEALCRKIDEVKAEDLMKIARRAISKPVSISAVGKDLRTVPNYEQVLQWFAQS
ncbi:hypothetical protein NGA_0239600 [Nannochloropsis gaditana CCMP526]|uniref:uncharacterized protein n=1 Tax=Nannochloropsis gaditana (strain CCMP526) TaxID=1093141 RepID=UPI00029F711E|nr:hypothetical protein NGA_0239600 [Nannochloropsis gaditana CCMP526]EKU21800.1 hypothetical protein NGA_0239600 [Nannochloropsis gaditana CCMP526]|eukprot:XP_005854553.1 hypothetical protein NGA_0239600 [Nannochloropsis gaditana CCMP526]